MNVELQRYCQKHGAYTSISSAKYDLMITVNSLHEHLRNISCMPLQNNLTSVFHESLFSHSTSDISFYVVFSLSFNILRFHLVDGRTPRLDDGAPQKTTHSQKLKLRRTSESIKDTSISNQNVIVLFSKLTQFAHIKIIFSD